MERFRRYKTYMIDTYGAPLYRVPIDLGLTCPHRAPDGSGGCTFCSDEGSRARHLTPGDSIEQQVRTGVELAKRRYSAEHFMAYIQAFTGTLAPVSEQRDVYRRLLEIFPFDSLSIGTRPDCLPEAVLDLLKELRHRIDLWVELGIQTVHDETLRRINRGHGWDAGRRAILDLHQRNIKVAAHVILGLPGETREHFNITAGTLAALPISGIKIHNLHVVRGTQLANEYAADPFPVYDEIAYADILIEFLRWLPPELAIIRMTTDTSADQLIAPTWKMGKGQFLNYVTQEMERRDVRQGDMRNG